MYVNVSDKYFLCQMQFRNQYACYILVNHCAILITPAVWHMNIKSNDDNEQVVSNIKSNMMYISQACLYFTCGHAGLWYRASPMMLHPSSFKNKSATHKRIIIRIIIRMASKTK